MNKLKKKNAAKFADPNAVVPPEVAMTFDSVLLGDFDAAIAPRFPEECADPDTRKILLSVYILTARQVAARITEAAIKPMDDACKRQYAILAPPVTMTM